MEPKTFLQNKLAQDESELDEVLPKVKSLRNEVTKLEELRKAYIENPALGDLDTVVEVSLVFPILTKGVIVRFRVVLYSNISTVYSKLYQPKRRKKR